MHAQETTFKALVEGEKQFKAQLCQRTYEDGAAREHILGALEWFVVAARHPESSVR